MAKVYSPPEGFEPPKHDYDNSDYRQREKLEQEYVARLAAEARRVNGTPRKGMVGEEVGFPHADGYARYLVWNTSPLELIHLPLGDAWAIPAAHERGLTLADIKRVVDRKRNPLFGNSALKPLI